MCCRWLSEMLECLAWWLYSLLRWKIRKTSPNKISCTLYVFYFDYQNIQLSCMMNANICYTVFNFPKRQRPSVCNESVECVHLAGKADLCLLGQGNTLIAHPACDDVWVSLGLWHSKTLMNLISWMVLILTETEMVNARSSGAPLVVSYTFSWL